MCVTNYLGKHLTIDGVCGKAGREKLADFFLFYNLLKSLPKTIGMVAITPPFVMQYLDPPDLEWGLTGVIMISTSHLTFHTFPERLMLHFDCFSCRPFDEKLVVKCLNDIFCFSELKVQVLDR